MADRVFCHQCSNEWARSEHGLICPECDSEFTEVIESSNDPRHVPIEDPDAFPPQLPHPSYSTHNPWTPIPAANAPDPDDADIERHVTTTRVPGSITYTTTTIRTGGQGGFQSRTTRTTNSRSAAIPISAPNSPFPELFRLLGGLGGPSAAPTYPSFPGDPSRVDRSRRNSDRGEPGSRLGGRFSYTSNAPWNQQDEIPEGNPGDPMAEMARFLATLSGTIPGDEGSGIQHLLHNLLAPGNAVGGDAVYSQEGFDRVITNLMEQNGSGNTPAPASRAAISSLPTRAIEESDFGDGGQAECNICMDEVELGEKVTILPCTHWYHGPCISAWLNQSDTCPVCRQGIMNQADLANQNDPNQPPTVGRIPFSSNPPSPNGFPSRGPRDWHSLVTPGREQILSRTDVPRPLTPDWSGPSMPGDYPLPVRPRHSPQSSGRTRQSNDETQQVESRRSSRSNGSGSSRRRRTYSDEDIPSSSGEASHSRRSHRRPNGERRSSTRSTHDRSGGRSGTTSGSTGIADRVRHIFGGGG